jgi:hypothetical protein
METEIGNPIEYNPRVIDKDEMDGSEAIQQHIPENQNDQYYYHPPQPQPYMVTPEQYQPKSSDIFTSLDKVTYVMTFVAFILGFFMGKTMQPVILRPG